MFATTAPYIIAFSALTFAGLAAITLVSFVNGLDGKPPASTPTKRHEAAA